jgi:hypothetical protein
MVILLAFLVPIGNSTSLELHMGLREAPLALELFCLKTRWSKKALECGRDGDCDPLCASCSAHKATS